MKRVVVGAALVIGAVLSSAAPGSASSTLTWSVVHSPSPVSGDILHGVSCVSAAACTAVGYYNASSGDFRTLVESWNGTRWSVTPSPSPVPSGGALLYGVSCASAAACMAVGYSINNNLQMPVIESWNGARWSVASSPSPGPGALYGVSCVSAAACTAVGRTATYQALIESWNGTSWSVTPSPNSGHATTLYGVSCVAAAACTAVGYGANSVAEDQTLIDSWNGTSWSVTPSPSPGQGLGSYLLGVSCVSAAACTAVGRYQSPGRFRTLIESWNGTSWSVASSRNPGHDNILYGVSCASAAACMAAGYSTSTTGTQTTLIESGTTSG